jgi:hypothetical protein
MNNISIELEIATMSLLLPFFILFLLDPHRLLVRPCSLCHLISSFLWSATMPWERRNSLGISSMSFGIKWKSIEGMETLSNSIFISDQQISKVGSTTTRSAEDLTHQTEILLSLSQTFGMLGDLYRTWNNLVFAAEMYRMALEKLFKCGRPPPPPDCPLFSVDLLSSEQME